MRQTPSQQWRRRNVGRVALTVLVNAAELAPRLLAEMEDLGLAATWALPQPITPALARRVMGTRVANELATAGVDETVTPAEFRASVQREVAAATAHGWAITSYAATSNPPEELAAELPRLGVFGLLAPDRPREHVRLRAERVGQWRLPVSLVLPERRARLWRRWWRRKQAARQLSGAADETRTIHWMIRLDAGQDECDLASVRRDLAQVAELRDRGMIDLHTLRTLMQMEYGFEPGCSYARQSVEKLAAGSPSNWVIPIGKVSNVWRR